MAVPLRTLFHMHSLTCSAYLLVPKAASGFFLTWKGKSLLSCVCAPTAPRPML